MVKYRKYGFFPCDDAGLATHYEVEQSEYVVTDLLEESFITTAALRRSGCHPLGEKTAKWWSCGSAGRLGPPRAAGSGGCGP